MSEYMEPVIEILTEKKLIGKMIEMSLAENRTFELWKSFMSRRKEITNSIGTDLYSIQVYNKSFDLSDFNMDTRVEKWAVTEVEDFNNIPEGMSPYTLPGGLYAVFTYKGNPNEFHATFDYIFKTWLPASRYLPDDRPHFEIMGEKYKNNDPESEETIWVPVKTKQ